jgi:hypothetical protein
MSARRASLRIVACGVLPVLLAAPLLAALHEAESRHRFCAQHGVLEDVAEKRAAGSEGVVAARAGAALRGGEADPDAGHLRCALEGVTRPRMACPSPSSVTALAPPPPVLGSYATGNPAPPTTPVVRFAPKTSPPPLELSL